MTPSAPLGQAVHQGSDFTYDAFLSYSHSDAVVTEALQRALHRVGRRMGQLRALRIYRDATDLAANPAFWAKLEEALASSRFLIAVVSPDAAASRYVNKELQTWLDERGSEHVLVALVGGELHWDTEQNRFDPDRSTAAPLALTAPGVFESEPLFVDLRDLDAAELRELGPGDFRSKVVDLAAPIHGKTKDELDSDDRRELRRFRRYRRAAVAGLATLLVASLVMSFLAVQQRNEARQQAANVRARELAALARIEDDPDRALVLAVEAQFATDSPLAEARSSFAAAVQRNVSLPARSAGPPMTEQRGNVTGVAFDPDGDRIASTSEDGSLVVWDRTRDELVRTEDIADGANLLAVDWGATGLAVGAEDGNVYLADPVSGAILEQVTVSDEAVAAVRWSHDASKLAVADDLGAVLVWDYESGDVVELAAGYDGQVPNDFQSALAWSPDDERIVTSGSADGTAEIVDVARGLSTTLEAQVGAVRTVDWSPVDDLVILGGSGGGLETFSARTGEFVSVVVLETDWVDTVAFSPLGDVFAVGGHDSQLRLFDSSSGRQLGDPLTSHVGWVNQVDWGPNGRQLATASTDTTVRIWTTSGVPELGELNGHSDIASDVVWSPEGRDLFSSGTGGEAIIWDGASLEPRHMLQTANPLESAAWSPDGSRVVAGDSEGAVLIWDTDSGEMLDEFLLHSDSVADVEWSASSELLATASTDGSTAVVEVGGTERLRVRTRLEGESNLAVAWSPDGERIVVGGDQGHATVWAVDSGEQRLELVDSRSEHDLRSLAWSPDGTSIAAGYSDSLIRIWDVGQGDLTQVLEGHNAEVLDLDWSPDGLMVVSASADATVRLWEVETGLQVGSPLARADWRADVSAAAWAPDGSRIATAFNVGTVQIWAGLSETEACARAAQALGPEALAGVIEGDGPVCADPARITDHPMLPVAVELN
ncbi:MAG: toll/interleukin-1 receptor domain-containing protein [Acidimicrobiales bacterium]